MPFDTNIPFLIGRFAIALNMRNMPLMGFKLLGMLFDECQLQRVTDFILPIMSVILISINCYDSIGNDMFNATAMIIIV